MVYKIKSSKVKEKKERVSPQKTYFYKWGKHHTSKYGGQDGTLEVYEIKNGDVKKVGETFVETRAMKGFEGEVMSVLFKEKKISEAEYNKSESATSGKGYYTSKNNFQIKPLGSMY